MVAVVCVSLYSGTNRYPEYVLIHIIYIMYYSLGSTSIFFFDAVCCGMFGVHAFVTDTLAQ